MTKQISILLTSWARTDWFVVFDFAVGTLTADVGVGFAAGVLALELDAGLKVLFKHKNE